MSEHGLESDHEGHLRALFEGEVDFIVIGGIAVMAHGFVRATADTDITANPEMRNLERLAAVLAGLDAVLPGADPLAGDPASARSLSYGGNPRFETKLGRLHIVQSPAGAPDYDGLAASAIEVDLDDLKIRVCAYPDLVAMKEATRRDQDLVDLVALREARDETS
ncbi:MAG TPA: hypothetical protein VHU14_08585 [Solirubrobacterales bacterium]|nr:hypothetical protein [Solirubrobacterales bacterium]